MVRFRDIWRNESAMEHLNIDVTKIVKYACLTGVAITAIVMGNVTLGKLIAKKNET